MSKNTFNQPPTSILSTESYQSDYFPSNRSRKKAIELRVRSILFTFLALVFLNLIVEQPIRSLNLLLRLKPESDKSHLRDPSNWSIHQSQGNDSLTKVQRLEYELITSNRSSSSSSSSSELKESLLLTTNKKLLNLNDNRWNLLMIHGLGDLGATQAHQISSSLRRSDPELFSKFNFIIPHAGLIRISVFEKDIRPGWFDIRSWDNINEDEDLDGFYSSVRSLQLMMTELGLDLNRTIVAGFSQGAVMSLLLTLTLKRPPLLTIMMSGYFPIQETIKELILQGKRNSTY
ncbi:Phospholipase/Carboxylesterase-domain-containing protein, partial [Phakopsora pachyrhizi]